MLPFLFSFQNIQDIIIFFEKPHISLKDLKKTIPMDGGQTARWLACLYYFIDQPQKSIEILDKEIQVSINLPVFTKKLEDLRKTILKHTKMLD